MVAGAELVLASSKGQSTPSRRHLLSSTFVMLSVLPSGVLLCDSSTCDNLFVSISSTVALECSESAPRGVVAVDVFGVAVRCRISVNADEFVWELCGVISSLGSLT
ncbi:unnamed protein product [Haemonchus placei]|uniref:Secreted protein n=1 Tax=Haemonchus placei TaxID=6290 RepID=A0A0N4X167_HAEPC|nr:unnamed protein product [Haemonchus placei]